MQELYEDFAEDRTLNGEDPISYTYFARIWKKHRSTIKPKSGDTFMKCHSCTLYKETRFGAAGIRATADPAVLADAKAAHDKHLKVRRSTAVCPESCERCMITDKTHIILDLLYFHA